MARTAHPPTPPHAVRPPTRRRDGRSLTTLVVLALVVAVLAGQAQRVAHAAGRLPDLWHARGVGDPFTGSEADSARGRLRPDLRSAIEAAIAGARSEGVELVVTSGWRSPDHQRWLLHRAVRRYGSLREAERWVATPADSRHVTGQAVDVGPPDAAAWLSAHGARWGLCQVFDNEPWHFELRTSRGGRCPARYPDNSHRPPRRGP